VYGSTAFAVKFSVLLTELNDVQLNTTFDSIGDL